VNQLSVKVGIEYFYLEKWLMTNRNYKDKRLLKSLNNLRKELGLPYIVVKKRKCLKCDKIFTSQGTFNRLCETCTRVNKNEDTVESYAVGKN